MRSSWRSTNGWIPVVFVALLSTAVWFASCKDSTSIDAVADSAVGMPAAGSNDAAIQGQDADGVIGCLMSTGQIVPVGTVYGTSLSCCLCTGDDRHMCAATPISPTDGGVRFCQSREDCATLRRADCIFFPGCSPVQGICTEYILTPLGIPGADAAVLDYCGCDGQTFHIEAYPDRPYAHLGACL
jgi:hypothetical protein